MVVQERPPGLVGRPTECAQESRDSAFGEGNAEHLEFAMNPGRAPQRIGRGHLCDQSAEFSAGAGPTSAPPLRLRQPGPESPEPLELPAHNRVCLDVAQGLAPVAPQIPERNPKHPIPRSSTTGASVFAETRLFAFGAPRSRWPRPDGR